MRSTIADPFESRRIIFYGETHHEREHLYSNPRISRRWINRSRDGATSRSSVRLTASWHAPWLWEQLDETCRTGAGNSRSAPEKEKSHFESAKDIGGKPVVESDEEVWTLTGNKREISGSGFTVL
jgi:hypothetical protein